MTHRNAALQLAPIVLQPERDAELCLRRASEYLALGGLADAAHWTRMAADAIAQKKRGH